MKNGLMWLKNTFGNQKGAEIANSWRYVFDVDNKASRAVLQDLARYCNLYNSSFVKGDNSNTAFNEGARDVFLHIIEMSNLSIEDILYLQNSK